MRTIHFITGNIGKFNEIKEFLKGSPIRLKQVALDLEELQSTDVKKIIEHKVSEAIRFDYSCFILEDSSLYINGLGRLPGPLIKWFEKELGNNGVHKLAMNMGNGTAVAETIIAYVENKKTIHYFHGLTRGRIVKPVGRNDFGWGPIFKPIGADKSFGEMPRTEKDKWSMRIKALKGFKKFLQARA